MCFCNAGNGYPYCDGCKTVFEDAKKSNMDNASFHLMIRMVGKKKPQSPSINKPTKEMWAFFIVGVLSGIFLSLIITFL